MSPRLRIPLIIIGVITIIVIAIFVVPRGLSLYYQIRGGQHIEYVLRFEKGVQELACEPLPLTNEEARKEVENGIVDLNRAIRLNKNNAQAYYYLGKAHCLLGNPAAAKENYLQFTQLKPSNPLGYIGLGFTYEILDDLPSAKSAWEKAALTHEEFMEAGHESFRERLYEEAIRWYELSILMDPNHANSWLHLGEAYKAISSPHRALDAYLEAWSIDPELATTLLVSELWDIGDFDMLEEVLQQSLNKFPNSKERLTWTQALGDYYIDRGEIDLGVDVYKETIQEFPSESDLHISLGWIYYDHTDDLQLALREFEQAIELDLISGEGEISIAKLYTREKRYQDADEYFLKAMERSPNNRWYHLARAENIRISGDIARAIDVYLELIARYPDFPNTYNQLAYAYRLNENYPEAIEAIEQAVNLMDPPLSGYYSRAGEIYRLAGMPDKAISAYYQALALNPNNEIALGGLQLLTGE